MKDENQTPVEQEVNDQEANYQGETQPGEFKIEISVLDNEIETTVASKGIHTAELIGIVTFVESLLKDMKEDLLDKMKAGVE